MRRRTGGDLAKDRGATTVEFALVLPIFLSVVAMAAFFGWHVYVQAQVERAAGRAARYAAVPTTTGAYAFCPSAVLTTVNAALVSQDATSAEVTVADSAGTLAAGAACTGTPRGYVRVTVSHEFTNPFSSLIGWFTPGSGSVTLRGTGQASVESR